MWVLCPGFPRMGKRHVGHCNSLPQDSLCVTSWAAFKMTDAHGMGALGSPRSRHLSAETQPAPAALLQTLGLWRGDVTWKVVGQHRRVRFSLCRSEVLANCMSLCLCVLPASSAFGVSIFMLGFSFNVVLVNTSPIFCSFLLYQKPKSALQTRIHDKT